MLKNIKVVFYKLDGTLKWILTLLFGTMSLIIFLQVIFRYIFKSPLAWSEELARYIFVWITFIGGAAAAIKGKHIGMEMFQDKLPNKLKKYAKLTASLITSVFFGITFFYTFTIIGKMMNQTSPAMGLPIGYPYLGIVIGSFIMCIWYVFSALLYLKGREEGETD